MAETPSYTRKAVKKYRSKFDIIQVRFPKGTRAKMADIDNINDYIVKCVVDSLNDEKKRKGAKP